jgi:carbon monoxide dehydrogenase subunit G
VSKGRADDFQSRTARRDLVMTFKSFHRFMFWSLLVATLFTCFGCQKIRKLLFKPPPEGVVQESHTIRLSGYEQTVTVKASPEAVSEFITDLENLVLPGYRTEEVTEFLAEGEVLGVGSSFPASINQMGVEISGQMIVIKREDVSMWWVFDNPQLFTVQRWSFKPVKEGTRLTFKVDYEIPAHLQQLVELTGIIEGLMKDIDLMLARIQAHFDPGLDAEELVAMGLRGEVYESLLQSNQAGVWIDASPGEVWDWASDAENAGMVLKELRMDDEDFYRILRAPSDTVVHAPAFLQAGALKIPVDAFVVHNRKSDMFNLRLYYVGSINMGIIEIKATAEGGGTSATASLTFEVPSSAYPNSIEVMVQAAGIPGLLRGRALLIKSEVENKV